MNGIKKQDFFLKKHDYPNKIISFSNDKVLSYAFGKNIYFQDITDIVKKITNSQEQK